MSDPEKLRKIRENPMEALRQFAGQHPGKGIQRRLVELQLPGSNSSSNAATRNDEKFTAPAPAEQQPKP